MKFIIFPGDAEKETWERVFSNFHDRDLKSTYLVLSHHGSQTDGATSAQMIEKIQPEGIFISCGRDMGYQHPARAVLTLLKQSPRLLYTHPHAISSFKCMGQNPHTKKDIIHHRMGRTQRAIFSTSNHGHLHVTLGVRGKVVDVSYLREKVYRSLIKGHAFKDFIAQNIGDLGEIQENDTALLQSIRSKCPDIPENAPLCLWVKKTQAVKVKDRKKLKRETHIIPYHQNLASEEIMNENAWHILLRHEKESSSALFTHFSIIDPVEDEDAEEETATTETPALLAASVSQAKAPKTQKKKASVPDPNS